MLIDATQPLYSGMPKAATLPDVAIEPLLRLVEGHPLETSMLSLPSHAGTHIDAPAHAVKGGLTIDQIPTDRFHGSGVVASVRKGAGEEIGIDDVVNGGPPVQRGDMLLLETGWADKFEGSDYADHPHLSEELAWWLVEQGVSLLAMDAATPDLAIPRRPEGFGFPVHHALLENDVLIAENLASLRGAAGKRVTVYAFPLLVKGGDAGHVRFVVEV